MPVYQEDEDGNATGIDYGYNGIRTSAIRVRSKDEVTSTVGYSRVSMRSFDGGGGGGGGGLVRVQSNSFVSVILGGDTTKQPQPLDPVTIQQEAIRYNSHADLVLLFSRETYTLRLAGEFAVLLTFGIVFPPLAIVICVAIVTQTIMTQRLASMLLIGSKAMVQKWERTDSSSRYDDVYVDNNNNSEDDDNNESSLSTTRSYELLFILFPKYFLQECSQIVECMCVLIPYISTLMMTFLSFSLFDTMADEHGDVWGLVILGCFVAIPVMEYLLYVLFVYVRDVK